jgi:hypothetical protein
MGDGSKKRGQVPRDFTSSHGDKLGFYCKDGKLSDEQGHDPVGTNSPCLSFPCDEVRRSPCRQK